VIPEILCDFRRIGEGAEAIALAAGGQRIQLEEEPALTREGIAKGKDDAEDGINCGKASFAEKYCATELTANPARSATPATGV